MKTSDLGVSAMYRILKKAGADRVSDESAEELRRVLEDIGNRDCQKCRRYGQTCR